MYLGKMYHLTKYFENHFHHFKVQVILIVDLGKYVNKTLDYYVMTSNAIRCGILNSLGLTRLIQGHEMHEKIDLERDYFSKDE